MAILKKIQRHIQCTQLCYTIRFHTQKTTIFTLCHLTEQVICTKQQHKFTPNHMPQSPINDYTLHQTMSSLTVPSVIDWHTFIALLVHIKSFKYHGPAHQLVDGFWGNFVFLLLTIIKLS